MRPEQVYTQLAMLCKAFASKFKAGDRVEHKLYGKGRVIREWGSWRACRECLEEFEEWQSHCHHCRKTTECLRISGRGVFDVIFHPDPHLHSINQRWLKKS